MPSKLLASILRDTTSEDVSLTAGGASSAGMGDAVTAIAAATMVKRLMKRILGKEWRVLEYTSEGSS